MTNTSRMGVELVALAGDGLEPTAEETRRHYEQGQQLEREQRDLPRVGEHGHHGGSDADEVAHDVGQRRREGLLCALDATLNTGSTTSKGWFGQMADAARMARRQSPTMASHCTHPNPKQR